MAQATRFPLLSLIDELLISIIQHVESKDDLCSLVLACSRLQGLAEPALYRFILIRKGTYAIRFSGCIARRPVRASFIRALHIRYRHLDRHGIEALNSCLRIMYNLRELMIEAPCCNDTHGFDYDHDIQGKIDYAEYFTFASSVTPQSQPRVQIPLQSCKCTLALHLLFNVLLGISNCNLVTLHSHNKEGELRGAFNIGKNAIIFIHPTIRNLTISCFDIGEDIQTYLLSNRAKTGLQSLTFEECNIRAKGLAAILSVPKALQRLIVGERLHHLDWHAHSPLGQYPESFLQALALQKDSLQHLKHISAPYGMMGSIANLSMDGFTKLKEIELDSQSVLGSILSETATRGSPILDSIYLRFFRPYRIASDQQVTAIDEDPVLGSLYKWFKLVRNLDFVMDFSYIPDIEVVLTELWKNEKNDKIWKKIFDLASPDANHAQNKHNKRRLQMFIVQTSGFIPPYMYGEERPVETLIFDSDQTE